MSDIRLRRPAVTDGAAVWRLVKASPPLDVNSAYLYLMLFRNFAATCVIAEAEGAIAGAITAYRLPEDSAVLFVWQVAVAEEFRGRGLGRRMLDHLLDDLSPREVHTTVSPGNAASLALFRAFARGRGAPFTQTECFSPDQFPDGPHEAESLCRIGPFPER